MSEIEDPNQWCRLTPRTLRIAAAGDLMCHARQLRFSEIGERKFDFDAEFAEVSAIFGEADLSIANLETVLAGPGVPYSGYPRFNTPDEFASAAVDAGINVLVTANNHCLDFGPTGLVRTLRTLDSLRVHHVGTWETPGRRKPYLLLRIRGFKIALLAYTYGVNTEPNSFAKRWVSVIDTQSIAQDLEALRSAKGKSRPDVVIAYLHWGKEYSSVPTLGQRLMVNWLLKRGVDIVFGSHPHVVQPWEIKEVHRDLGRSFGVVFYSLGNLISGQTCEACKQGAIAWVVLRKWNGKVEISDCRLLSTRTRSMAKQQGRQIVTLLFPVTGRLGLREHFLALPCGRGYFIHDPRRDSIRQLPIRPKDLAAFSVK